MFRETTGLDLATERVEMPRRHPSARALLAGLSARLRGPRLDRALAGGADPTSTMALARRASWLTADRQRERMAEAINRLLAASRRAPTWTSAVPLNRSQISTARALLLQIEAILLSEGPIYCQGIAMLRLLISDGASPLYSPARPGSLSIHLEAILEALEGGGVR